MRRAAAALMLIGLMGCGGMRPVGNPMLPITRVPKTIRLTAMAKQPGVRYHTAWLLPNGGYQLRGNDLSGKSHEIALTADGRIMESH